MYRDIVIFALALMMALLWVVDGAGQSARDSARHHAYYTSIDAQIDWIGPKSTSGGQALVAQESVCSADDASFCL